MLERYRNLVGGYDCVFDMDNDMWPRAQRLASDFRQRLDEVWYQLSDEEKEQAPRIPFVTMEVSGGSQRANSAATRE